MLEKDWNKETLIFPNKSETGSPALGTVLFVYFVFSTLTIVHRAYIDGKFSFFPAGTGLWRSSHHLLAAAYEEMMHQFTSKKFFDSPIPQMPTVQEIANYLFKPQDHWTVKRYESLYMPIQKREFFWKEIVRQVEEFCTLQVETRVISIEFTDDACYLIKTVCNGTEEIIYAKEIVLAGGRFMPLQNLLKNIGSNSSSLFRRFEFGFRVEVPTSNPDIQKIRALGLKDPKLVMSPSANVEFRTFCFCVDGQVSKSCINGLITYSGRADVDPTGRTNFAILVRSTDSTAISQQEIDKFLAKPFSFSNGSNPFREEILAYFYNDCPCISMLIVSAIESLFGAYPKLNCNQLRLHGPCLEGVGLYPNVDVHMHIKGVENVYAIGDTHGGLRGLVPSFLSGLYLSNVLKFKQTSPLFLSKSAGKQAELAAVLGPIHRLDLGKEAGKFVDVRRKVTHLFSLYQKSAQYDCDKTLLVESTSLAIDCLGGEPKFAIGEFFESLSEEEFINKTQYSGATMTCYLTLLDGKNGSVIKETVGTCNGTMVAPRGSNGFGWDRMFVPVGQPARFGESKTFGEMELAEKNWLSARTIAANQLY